MLYYKYRGYQSMARKKEEIKTDRVEELELFLNYLLLERKYSMNTVTAYKHDINSFIDFLKTNGLKLQDVDTPLIRTYMLDLTVKNYQKTSIRRIMSGLSQFYSYMTLHGYVNKNPFELVNKPKASRKLPDFLGTNEIDQLLALNMERKDPLATRDQAILELLFASGLRVSELCGLTLQTLNIRGRTVRVIGKGNKERIVPFTNRCQRAIEIYLNETRPLQVLKNKSGKIDNSLFLNAKGTKLTPRGVQYILSEIEKKIGAYFKLHPHKLRHTFATTLLNKGANLRTIQELMGHESIGTTQIYTHVTYSNMKQTYDNAFPRAKRKIDDKD